MNLDPVHYLCHTDPNSRWGEAIELGEKILPPFKRFHGEKVEYSKTHFTTFPQIFGFLFSIISFHFYICSRDWWWQGLCSS